MRNLTAPIIFLSLLIFSEYFAFRGFRLFFSDRGARIFSWAWWLFFAFEIALFILSRGWDNNLRNLVVNFIMILFIVKLVAALTVFIGDAVVWVRSLLESFGSTSSGQGVSLSRRSFVSKMALGISAIPLLSMTYGILRTAFDFKLHRETLRFPNFPDAFNGLKIVQISDIHTGSLINTHQLEKAVDLILAEKPDIIVFTGDIVNNRTDEAWPYAKVLSRLKAPMGVYSVLGNHDYGDYETWATEEARQKNMDDMYRLHRELGWELLLNESRSFEKDGQKWALLGVENWGANLHFPRYGKLKPALEQAADAPFKILLSHDPSHWNAEVNDGKTDIDLALAGHTHGFQFGVEIPGLKWSPSQYIYPQWAGLYNKGKQLLYVNRGLGCLGYMGRIGIRPEITVLEFFKS